MSIYKCFRNLNIKSMINSAIAEFIIPHIKAFRNSPISSFIQPLFSSVIFSKWNTSIILFYFGIVQSYFLLLNSSIILFTFDIFQSYFLLLNISIIPLTLLLGNFQSSLLPECKSSQERKAGIIYARVSTKAQAEEGYSLPAQIDMLKKIAERESIKVLKILEDGGKTGRNLNRENLWKILQYAEKRKISYLLVIEIDRIGRNSIENLYFMNLLKENGVKIRTKDGEIDLNKITDLITATIKSLASQIEINNLSERTQRGKIKKWKGKGWIRPEVPLGYERDNGWIKKLSQYSQLIKDIYNLFERYGDYSKVQRIINKNFKELLKDRPLTVAQIKRILSDPVYIGKPQYGNEAVDSPELAFIDEYTLDKAQQIKEKIKKRYGRKKSKKVITVENIVERVGIGSAEKVLPIAVLCPSCENKMVKNGTRQIRDGWVYNYLCPACGKQRRIPTEKQLDQLNWDISRESTTTVGGLVAQS